MYHNRLSPEAVPLHEPGDLSGGATYDPASPGGASDGGGFDTPPITGAASVEVYQTLGSAAEQATETPTAIPGQPPIKGIPATGVPPGGWPQLAWWQKALNFIFSDWTAEKAAGLAVKSGATADTAQRTGQAAGFLPIVLGLAGAAGVVYLFTHRSRSVSA